MKKILPSFIFLLLLISSCSDDECPSNSISCGISGVVVANQTLNAIQTNNYQIQSVILTGNCLEVTISASGCNPDDWTMNIFSDTATFSTFPLQRFAKIEVNTNQDCLAAFQKTATFDLQPFQIEGQDSVIIVLEGWNTPINYQY